MSSEVKLDLSLLGLDCTVICTVYAQLRPCVRTKDIQPLTEHRAHLAEHFQQVRETSRPLFITANGRTAAVVLSPDSYDALIALV